MKLSRHQGKILWKKGNACPFWGGKIQLNIYWVKPFGCNRTISADILPSSFVGLMWEVPCSFLPPSFQTLKPLAIAKVTISGDLDCCRFGKKQTPPPNNTNCAWLLQGMLIWVKQRNEVKLTNLSRYFIGWEKHSGKS
jgi:hypothetical protein